VHLLCCACIMVQTLEGMSLVICVCAQHASLPQKRPIAPCFPSSVPLQVANAREVMEAADETWNQLLKDMEVGGWRCFVMLAQLLVVVVMHIQDATMLHPTLNTMYTNQTAGSHVADERTPRDFASKLSLCSASVGAGGGGVSWALPAASPPPGAQLAGAVQCRPAAAGGMGKGVAMGIAERLGGVRVVGAGTKGQGRGGGQGPPNMLGCCTALY